MKVLFPAPVMPITAMKTSVGRGAIGPSLLPSPILTMRSNEMLKKETTNLLPLTEESLLTLKGSGVLKETSDTTRASLRHVCGMAGPEDG